MRWNIITDSSCDMFELESQYNEIYFSSIPFVISVGTRDLVDDESLKTSEMIDKMETSEELSHTSCPSPGAWYQEFEKPGYTIAVTISSKLSGSYNSANTAKNMILEASPDKKIALVDSRSTGPEIVMIVHKICECIKMGADFDTVVKEANECARHTHIVFALSSFNNLIKNGRMNKIVGFIAGKLNFWGIGIGSDEGTIRLKQKVRGRNKALEVIIADIKERGAECKEIVISHCQNSELAEKLKDDIQCLWHDIKVNVVPTRGLCSYYAERGGLIIAYR